MTVISEAEPDFCQAASQGERRTPTAAPTVPRTLGPSRSSRVEDVADSSVRWISSMRIAERIQITYRMSVKAVERHAKDCWCTYDMTEHVCRSNSAGD